MEYRLSKPMTYAGRLGRQQADQAIKRDCVRALVELITNSDDSYRRMEANRETVDGRIIVAVSRKHKNSVIRVLDFAEGMTQKKMDESLGVYAEEVSGIITGQPVTGYFGRGMKDAFLGLGEGKVYTIRKGILNRGWLGLEQNRPWYKSEDETVATKELCAEISDGIFTSPVNGTIVEITVTRDDVSIPHIDNLKRCIETYFSLRNIMSSSNRVVELWDIAPNRSPKISRLSYSFPIGDIVLDKEGVVPGYDAPFKLSISRSELPLTLPNEEGWYAQGGLLIIGAHQTGEQTIYDNTLFGFRGLGADKFFGKVICPHIVILLKNDEPVVLATRDALDWSHQFNRVLKREIERILEPLIKEEENRLKKSDRDMRSHKLREKINSVLSALNNIAKNELKIDIEKEREDGEKVPYVPEDGFGFVPQFANIVTGKPAPLLIRGKIPDKVEPGVSLTIQSDNPEILVMTPTAVIEQLENWPGIGEAKVILEGRQIGAEGIIAASLELLKCEAFVRVIAKRQQPKPHEKKRKTAGLFKGILFKADVDPRIRARFSDGDIIVATKSGSVAPYVDEDGNGSETPQGQVLLAELIGEAMSREIAERGVRSGRFVAPPGGEGEAIQREIRRLQYEYAGKIHELMVEPKYRNIAGEMPQRGRPKKEQTMKRSVEIIE